MSGSSTHHAIDYIEFTVTDMAAAKAFYATAFGWSFVDYGPGYAGIRAVGSDDREMGGLALGTKDSPPSGGSASGFPLVVLYSNDLEHSLSRVRASGGTISKEIFGFPGGKRFEFEDPSGNVLAVWTKTKA